MTNVKWTKFTVTADFNTNVRNIYQAWATTAGLESWFLKKAEFFTIPMRLREPEEFIQTEDTYIWHWHGYNDSSFEKGQILEANDTNRLKFTFSGNTVVTVSIKSKKGLTVLELTQENIPEENDPSKNLFVQCQLGWTFYLANLKSIIEGGIDLRNKRTDVHSNFK